MSKFPSWIFGLSFAVSTLTTAAAAQQSNPSKIPPLVIEKQGSFFVGGKVITSPGIYNNNDPSNPAGQTQVGEGFNSVGGCTNYCETFTIGANCTLRRVIVDAGVEIPDGTSIDAQSGAPLESMLPGGRITLVSRNWTVPVDEDEMRSVA